MKVLIHESTDLHIQIEKLVTQRGMKVKDVQEDTVLRK